MGSNEPLLGSRSGIDTQSVKGGTTARKTAHALVLAKSQKAEGGGAGGEGFDESK